MKHTQTNLTGLMLKYRYTVCSYIYSPLKSLFIACHRLWSEQQSKYLS